MNTSKPVVVVTYLFGKNIDELPENELIDALRNIEKKIDSLKEYKTPSTRIDQIIAEHEEAIQVILTRLDSGAEAK